MAKYRHLELLSRGPVSMVRPLNHRPLHPEAVAELASEWNSVADRANCRSLCVDLSNLDIVNSDMLSKLIVLQRRLKQKEGTLLLCGLSPHVREIFGWTRLDRFFEIKEDERQDAAACV